MASIDALGRPLASLRVSVTDRCNLRCEYCMPERDYVWLPRAEILSFEEIAIVVEAFARLGVERVRLTGGEPLLRRDLPRLVSLLAGTGKLSDLALTTNGVSLAASARELRQAGLHRITVSLDTLRRDRFEALTRFDRLDRVLEGLEAAAGAEFSSLKIDAVVVRGVNDDEITDLLEHGRRIAAEVRYIEYMDVGGATRWSREKVVSRAEILETIGRRFGKATPLPGRGPAPAERFRLSDGTTFGIVGSMTAPFCGACDRSRVTADGIWYLCLYASTGTDLRSLVRSGASVDDLAAAIAGVWRGRRDRGAEDRLARVDRPLLATGALKNDPHLEMHTRGG
jgi:cyclic pyranopterin phosphate synthase